MFQRQVRGKIWGWQEVAEPSNHSIKSVDRKAQILEAMMGLPSLTLRNRLGASKRSFSSLIAVNKYLSKNNLKGCLRVSIAVVDP